MIKTVEESSHVLNQISPPTLRMTDRKALLRHLAKLADADPTTRADAALKASELLQRKGVPWIAFIPLERETSNAPAAWPAPATSLLDHPDLTKDERAYVRKVAAWKSPGTDCLARLQAIAERVGA